MRHTLPFAALFDPFTAFHRGSAASGPTGKNFTYYDDAYIFAIAPAIEGVGLGPNWGGTYLRIEGANFVDHWAKLNRCKFSRKDLLGIEGNETMPDYIVEAVFISKTIMYCYAPHYYLTTCNDLYCEDEDVKVTISYNNQQYTDSMSATERRYLYYPQLKVDSLSPDNGPHKEDFKFGQFIQTAGPLVAPRYYASIKGHTTVDIIGDNFKPPPGLTEKTFCRFDNVTVSAETIYSRNRMTCTTDDVAVPGKYMLQVTRNGQDWTEQGPDFHFYGAYDEDPAVQPQRRVLRFVPRSGYIEGHTKVLMLGSEYVNSTQIRTWMGQHPPIPAEYIGFNRSDEKWATTNWQEKGLEPYKGYYVASTMIYTVAPEHKATANLDVIVTTNEQEWTLADMTFYFSRTYSHACRTYLHTDPGVAGLTKKFLIEARSKEGETMTAGGDFFYVDLWGGDTFVRDNGEPFHYSSEPRDDREGKQKVNITDNRWAPLDPDEDVPGTYWAIYYTTSSGVYYVEIMISGDQIGDAPFHVAIHPDITSPDNCFAIPGYSFQADGLIEMQAGIAALFHVQMRDKFGNNRTMNPSSEQIGLSIENTPSRASLIIDMEDGTYDVWWVSIYLGYYQVNVTIIDPQNPQIIQDPKANPHPDGPSMFVGSFWDWRSIGNFPLNAQIPLPYEEDDLDWWDTLDMLQPAPWTTQCKPGEPSTFGCVTTGHGVVWAIAGVPANIDIDAKDLFSNNVIDGNGDFKWHMQGFVEEIGLVTYDGYATDYKNGTYNINYTAEVASQPQMTSRMLYAFSIYLRGSWNEYRHLAGSPFFKVYVYPGPSYGPSCYAEGDGVLDAVAGREATFKIYPRDKYNNHQQFGQNESVLVSLVIDDEETFFPVVNCPRCIEGHTLWGEKPEGEYPFYQIARYSPGRSGFHFLKTVINEEHIDQSPFYITIPPPHPRLKTVFPSSGPTDNTNGSGTTVTIEVEYENKTDYFRWLTVLEETLGGTRRLAETSSEAAGTNSSNQTNTTENPQYSMFFRFVGQDVESDFEGTLDSETGLMHFTIDRAVLPSTHISDPCVGLIPGRGGEFCRNETHHFVPEDAWHRTIDMEPYDYADVCNMYANTNGQTCEEFCEDMGRACYHAMKNVDVSLPAYVNASVCDLGDNDTHHATHTSQPTTHNGCDQSWPNQICGCGPSRDISSYFTTSLMQRTFRQEYSEVEGFEYTFFDPRVIESAGIALSPPLGPSYGETKVTIHSDGLFNSGQSRCMFGDAEVDAIAAGACSDPAALTEVVCLALGTCTRSEIKTLALCIVAGECYFEGDFIEIAVTAEMCGQIEGSVWNAEVWTPAGETWSLLVPLELRCTSPNVSSTNGTLSIDGVYNTSVWFALNGQQYSAVSAPFLYYQPGLVETILPKSGPIQGGTTMVITGSSVWETGLIACRNGDAGPRQDTGAVVWSADREVDGQTLVTAAEVAQMPVLHRWALHQQRASMNDVSELNVTCDSVSYRGIYGAGETVLIEISLNGQQFSISNDKDNFWTFYDVPVLGTVLPDSGPLIGGQPLVITAKLGTGFPTFDPEETACVFIDDTTDPPTMRYSPAVYDVVAAVVTCDTPAWPLASHVRVEVAMNGQQPSLSDIPYAFVPVVTDMDVAYGPFSGGTTLLVTGVGFTDTTITRQVGATVQILDYGVARCQFYDPSGIIDPDCLFCEVMATYINATAITCVSPDYSDLAIPNGNYDPNFINYWDVHVIWDKCTDAGCFGNHSSKHATPYDTNNIFGYYVVPAVTMVQPTPIEAEFWLSGTVQGGTPLVLTGVMIHPQTTALLPVRCGFFGEGGAFFSSPVTGVSLPAAGQSGQIFCETPRVMDPQVSFSDLQLQSLWRIPTAAVS